MLSFKDIIRFITILLAGLTAGLFYAYSCSVNIGLHALPDKEYLMAMKAINDAIQNPWFFAGFMGLLVFLPLSCIQSYRSGLSFYLLLGASLSYFIFVFGVTAWGNVPLNNQLADLIIESASPQLLSEARKIFEEPWNNFHLIRSIASVVTFALLILAALMKKIR